MSTSQIVDLNPGDRTSTSVYSWRSRSRFSSDVSQYPRPLACAVGAALSETRVYNAECQNPVGAEDLAALHKVECALETLGWHVWMRFEALREACRQQCRSVRKLPAGRQAAHAGRRSSGRAGGSRKHWKHTSRKLATSLRKELGLASISRCCISASSMYVLRRRSSQTMISEI